MMTKAEVREKGGVYVGLTACYRAQCPRCKTGIRTLSKRQANAWWKNHVCGS